MFHIVRDKGEVQKFDQSVHSLGSSSEGVRAEDQYKYPKTVLVEEGRVRKTKTGRED